MYKSMFLVLSAIGVKTSCEKHSHKGPIISVLYFSNVKKIYISKNLLIYINVCMCARVCAREKPWKLSRKLCITQSLLADLYNVV